MSTSRLTRAPDARLPSVVTASVCGIRLTEKRRPATALIGEADAVDRDRALARDKARELRRRLDLELDVLAIACRALEARHDAHAVDVAGHQMTAEPVGKSQRLFQIDRARSIEPCRAAQRLGRHVEGERRLIDGDDRQAAAADGDAVADAAGPRGRASPASSVSLSPSAAGCAVGDAADCLRRCR